MFSKYVLTYLLWAGAGFSYFYSYSVTLVIQLLNALFGMNTAAQHTYMYSPFISSLTFKIADTRQ